MAKKKEKALVVVPEVDKPLKRYARGRPEFAINNETIYKLGKIHCTIPEIAAVLDCSEELINHKYMRVLQRGHRAGEMSMKRKMHKIAMEGDTKMLIWLSKQRLGYRDTPIINATQINFKIVIDEVPK